MRRVIDSCDFSHVEGPSDDEVILVFIDSNGYETAIKIDSGGALDLWAYLDQIF